MGLHNNPPLHTASLDIQLARNQCHAFKVHACAINTLPVNKTKKHQTNNIIVCMLCVTSLMAICCCVSSLAAFTTYIAESVKYVSGYHFSFLCSPVHLHPLLLDNLQVIPMVHQPIVKKIMVEVLLAA